MPKHDHPPYFPFYVDDFISDSAVDAMSNDELGIYVRLLCKAWKETPVGTIPNEDRVLANWSKASPAVWSRCKPGVLRAFVLGDDDRYHQKRMEHEWAKLIAAIELKSESGRKAAGKRWQSKRNAVALPTQCHSESESESESESLDDDDDGARDITLEELGKIRSKFNRLAKLVPCLENGDRDLVLKVAVLWHNNTLSENDVEQVIESFDRNRGKIITPAAWLHESLRDRCAKDTLNFDALLASAEIPKQLERPT